MDWDNSQTPTTYSMHSFSSLSSKRNLHYNESYCTDRAESTPILSKDAVEKPKIPLRRHFNPIRHLIHLFALGASGGVLQLTFRNVYWSDEAEWNRKWYLLELGQQDTFNALQFVAKIHEILVVASLSSMVIHIVRRKLVGEEGIPFGLLMGAYQVGSAEYLFSGSFGHPFLKALRPFSAKTFMLALGLALAIIYANMIGPASAIAVIPNLDWWPIQNPFSGRLLTTYIGLPFTKSYPTVVSSDTANEPGMDSCNITNPPTQCLGGGYDSINQWVFAWAQEGIVYDIPMPSMLVRAERELATRFAPASSSGNGVAFATTVKSSAAVMLDLFWQYVSTNSVGTVSRVERPQLISSRESELYAPLVQVQCDVADYASQRGGQGGVSFQTNLLSNFTSENAYRKGAKWQVPRDLWDFDRSLRALNFTWIPTSDLDSQAAGVMGSSIAALVTVPLATWSSGFKTATQKSMLVPCVVDARWAATEVNYDPKNSVVVKHNLSDMSAIMNSATQNSDVRAQFGLGNPIHIESGWAEFLDPKTPAFGDTRHNASEYQNLSAMQNLLYQFVVSNPDSTGNTFYSFTTPQNISNDNQFYSNVSSIVASIITMVVADGLARESQGSTLMELKPEHDGNITVVNLQFLAGGQKMEPFEISADKTKGYVPVWFNVARWGYGYGFKGQTIFFAVAVLFLHAALCVGYFFATFWFWAFQSGWTSHAWKDMGDLVALALGSREPEEFRNAGAGIKKSKTLNVMMNIRERADCELELVANRRGGSLAPHEGLLKVRKKYGS